MSKEGDQAIALLAILAGTLETLRIGQCFQEDRLKLAIHDSFQATQRAIVMWPLMVNKHWVKQKRDEFMKYVDTLTKADYPAIEIVMMSERIVIDLSGMYPVNHGIRSQLIDAILPGIQVLVNHVDPEGEHFRAIEEAGAIMDVLYKTLEVENEYAVIAV